MFKTKNRIIELEKSVNTLDKNMRYYIDQQRNNQPVDNSYQIRNLEEMVGVPYQHELFDKVQGYYTVEKDMPVNTAVSLILEHLELEFSHKGYRVKLKKKK